MSVVCRWLGGIPPVLMDLREAADHGIARLQGVCHPLLLAPCLAPLPAAPTAKEVFVPGAQSQAVLGLREPLSASDNESGASGGEDTGTAGMPRPVDLRVPPGARVASVTGPNTGGKTAALKTLGMSVLM